MTWHRCIRFLRLLVKEMCW
ncbi:hypothetical protein MTR67_038486 [Solanum verrucosum]|uniref:Uncharacterized protein n=1 Tax=Solanum verrucosum TaxID=315347 RepID=A0AAF0UGL1_SOLVR|nr:hypothetical protein MTR67_038486 [Solanum verrucosum]